MSFEHRSVLLHETIDGLDVNPNGVYVDCTLGGCGHALYLLSQLSERGHLYAFDQDMQALDNARIVLAEALAKGKVTLIHDNFSNLGPVLKEAQVTYVDGIYYDLGVSSPQFDQAERGFSYNQEARLDMRMNQSQSLNAYEIVNDWDYAQLVKIIYRYGEEKFAKRIARSIEIFRQKQVIETTTQLADIIKEAIPAAARRSGGHPAKRTFQAIRMAVNDELNGIETSLKTGLKLLKIQGRMAVITFHSLEDRLVKQVFREASTLPETPHNLPLLPEFQEAEYRIVNRKPIMAGKTELAENHRAHSARLRIIERHHFKEDI